MYSIYSNIENRMKDQASLGLEHIIRNFGGVEIEVFEPKKDSITDVYGNKSGELRYVSSGIIEGLVTGDEFAPADSYSSGNIVEGWLYVKDHDKGIIRSGCRIKIKSEDEKELNREYQVVENQDLGTTLSIFTRFRISAIG